MLQRDSYNETTTTTRLQRQRYLHNHTLHNFKLRNYKLHKDCYAAAQTHLHNHTTTTAITTTTPQVQPRTYTYTTTTLRLQYYYFKTAMPMLQRQNYIRKTCGYKTKTTKLQRYIDDCSTAATQRQIDSNTYSTTTATAQP